MVIIYPNSHEKFTKSEIRSTPIHMKSLPKVKLGQVQVGSNIAQNHSSSP